MIGSAVDNQPISGLGLHRFLLRFGIEQFSGPTNVSDRTRS